MVLGSMDRVALIALVLSAIWLDAFPASGPLTTSTVKAQAPERDDRDSGADDRGPRRQPFGRRESGWRGRRDRSDNDRERQRRNRDDESESDRGNSSSSGGASSASSTVAGMNMEDYARSLIKKYDKNGNMMLEADEQAALRGPAAAADADGDRVITLNELVAKLSGGSSTSSTGAGSTVSKNEKSMSDGSKDVRAKRVFTGTAGGRSAGSDSDKRSTYRFAPASERLPSGLPSWFKSRDKNGDGQVSMSEYSRTWSQRLVDEFRRYDANDDGIITPKEVAK
jgi:hypothetical protein